MSAWMFLPFAFGVFSFVSISVFKKIRHRSDFSISLIPDVDKDFTPEVKECLKQSWTLNHPAIKIDDYADPKLTGLPVIDKNIAEGKLSAGMNNFIGHSQSSEKYRSLQEKAIKENRCVVTATQQKGYNNPVFGEITLPFSFLPFSSSIKHVSNEHSNVACGDNVSKFKLKNKPIDTTIVGTVYQAIRGQGNIAIATFCVKEAGVLQFRQIGNVQPNDIQWGHYDDGVITLEWNKSTTMPMCNNYIVASYSYRGIDQWQAAPNDDAEPHGFIHPPIDSARWSDLVESNACKHKEFTGETKPEDFFIPKSGPNIIRLLPPLKDGKFHVCRQQHYWDGQSVQCGKIKDGNRFVGECPICERYHKLWKENGSLSGDDRKLKPTERHYYNVLVDGEVKMLSVGKMVHAEIVKIIIGDDEKRKPSLGDITNPATGRDITLIKTMRGVGSMQFPEYKVVPKESKPVGTEREVKSIMDKTYDLEAVAKKWEKTPEELNVALQKILGNNFAAYNNWKSRNNEIDKTLMSAMDVAKNMQAEGRAGRMWEPMEAHYYKVLAAQDVDQLKKDLVVDDLGSNANPQVPYRSW